MTHTGDTITSLTSLVNRVLDICQEEDCPSLAHTSRNGKRLCRNCADEFDQNLSPDYEPGPPEGHYR